MDCASCTGGISFGRTKGTSGSEADDETQLTFYTEQYRSRRRSKGNGIQEKVPEPGFVWGEIWEAALCFMTDSKSSSSTWSQSS